MFNNNLKKQVFRSYDSIGEKTARHEKIIGLVALLDFEGIFEFHMTSSIIIFELHETY